MFTGFAVIAAFMLGAWAMFKLSAYYNAKIIEAMRGRPQRRQDPFEVRK